MRNRFLNSKNKSQINAFNFVTVKNLERELQESWVARDMEKSIQLLSQILKVSPHNVNARLLLGRAYGMQFKYSDAISALSMAVDGAPKNKRVELLLRAGDIAKNFFDPTIAKLFLEEAVMLTGTIHAKLVLAEFLLRTRKEAVAESLVTEILHFSPNDSHANFLWCLIHEDQVEESIKRLQLIVSSEITELKVKATYQLAKILDRIGDYKGAMASLVQGKNVFMPARETVVQNRRHVREQHLKLAQKFATIVKNRPESDLAYIGEEKKLALLCGHPRSGTTLLEQILDAHPDIISAEETDNFYMAALSPLMRNCSTVDPLLQIVDKIELNHLLKARENYFSIMDRCLGESVGLRLLIDKNPSLTSLLPMVFRIFPETKVITMIRDPRDVILSCYMQPFVPISAISGNYLTLEDTAAEYAGVMNVWEIVAEHNNNVCEIRYEDIVENLEMNVRQVLTFLDIKWNSIVLTYDKHSREKIVRSPTANAVTEKVHTRSKNRWKNYEGYLERAFDSLSPYLKRFAN